MNLESKVTHFVFIDYEILTSKGSVFCFFSFACLESSKLSLSNRLVHQSEKSGLRIPQPQSTED